MAILDDITLINKFLQGEEELLANRNLRVECVFETTQLVAKDGEFVAVIPSGEKIPTVSLNVKSQYWELIHPMLLRMSFVPVGQPELQGLMKYEQHEIPPGYEIHYSSAKILWREWWRYNRRHNPSTIELDFLVLSCSRWYALRGIAYNPEELFLTTLRGEVRLQYDDKIVWLKRSPNYQVQRNRLRDRSIPEPVEQPSLPEQTISIAPSQREYAEILRPIAIRLFKQSTSLKKIRQVKPGVWVVPGINYNLGFISETNTLLITETNRGTLCKYKGEILDYAANILPEDVIYWQKINDKLDAINQIKLSLK